MEAERTVKAPEKKRYSLRTRMMSINVGIAMASFITCGLLFVLAVGLLVEKYVNRDLDFFLTEMGDNLSGRLAWLEEAVYEIRDSQALMGGLSDGGQTFGLESMQEEFRHAVDINDPKNQGDGSGPVVDRLYLFCENGRFLADYYYAMVRSEIEESDRTFSRLFEDYQEKSRGKEGFQSFFAVDGDNAYLSCSILDETMEETGVVLFRVSLPAIRRIMEPTQSYEDSFWILYGGEEEMDSARTGSGSFLPDMQEGRNRDGPYVAEAEGKRYRMYHLRLCLNMRVFLGIQENQALLALYDSLNVYVFGIAVVLLGGLVSFVLFTYKVTRPIEEVTDRMQQVQAGNFETRLPDYHDREFHEISRVFNEMTEYINHLIHQVYQKQITIKEMELKFLQTQMNPHFMFNVLNALALQARIDGNGELCRLISGFSRLIQAKIYRSNTEKVQICQELEYVKYYLEIQNFRYGDRLSYSIETKEEGFLELYIPKLCIQLIVENAVVHGLEPKTGPGQVNIVIDRGERSDTLRIDIVDNGVGFATEGQVSLPLPMDSAPMEGGASAGQAPGKEHNHVGLNNVHHIIRLLYGEEYGVSIVSRPNEGTKVTILLPFDRGVENF